MFSWKLYLSRSSATKSDTTANSSKMIIHSQPKRYPFYTKLLIISEISVMTLQLTSQLRAKILRITKRQDGDQCELLAKYYTLINPDARKKHFLPLCLVKQIGNHVAKNFLSQMRQYNKFTS